jgi:alpha-1,2-mannosyltransferase
MPVHLAFILHLIVTAAALAALYRWYPSRRLATAHTVLIIVVLLGFETLSIRATWPSQALWDFQACYYPAGDAVLHHDLAKLADLYRRTVQGFVNMPIIAFLFSPFALLGATSGSVVYTAAGGAAAVAAWYLLVRLADLRQRERWILALLFVANGPLINGLKFGNTSQFILLALAAGLALLRGNRAAAAGVLLGVVAVLKPAMGLFGVFFLLRRDFRGLAGFMAAGAVLTLLSIAVFGWSFNLFWFQTSILQFGHQWFSAFSVQSIPGFILRFRSDPALMTNWQPVVPTHSEQLTAQALIGLLYLIAATACFSARAAAVSNPRQDDTRRDLQYLLVICLSIVASPLSWSHYYCWLLVPTAFFLGAQSPKDRFSRALGWLAIALVTPLVVWPLQPSNPILMRVYHSVALSHPLFGGLVWFGLIARSLARTRIAVSAGRTTSLVEATQASSSSAV